MKLSEKLKAANEIIPHATVIAVPQGFGKMLGTIEQLETTIADLVGCVQYYRSPAPTDPDELVDYVNNSPYTPGLANLLIERAERLIT